MNCMSTIDYQLMSSNNITVSNGPTHLQPDYLQYRKVKNLTTKQFVRNQVVMKTQNTQMQQTYMMNYQKVCKQEIVTPNVQMTTTNVVNNSYSYQHDYNYPITMIDWQHTQTFSVLPVPVIIPPTTIYPSQLTPVYAPVIQPLPSPILPQKYVIDVSNYYNTNEYYSTKITAYSEEVYKKPSFLIQEIDSTTNSTSINDEEADASVEIIEEDCDPLESYLKLPKKLFPKPNKLALDPNPLIDEFCKMPNLQRHMPWILDLEFGIPKSPTTRPIPTYNVKFNSIHCKNSPDAIHPGFESCDPDFKKAFLFHYDCIVSAWYKSYMIWYCDRSVDNFQSWLLLPMQLLGMCWP